MARLDFYCFLNTTRLELLIKCFSNKLVWIASRFAQLMNKIRYQSKKMSDSCPKGNVHIGFF